jgi:hypothetical protein
MKFYVVTNDLETSMCLATPELSFSHGAPASYERGARLFIGMIMSKTRFLVPESMGHYFPPVSQLTVDSTARVHHPSQCRPLLMRCVFNKR